MYDSRSDSRQSADAPKEVESEREAPPLPPVRRKANIALWAIGVLVVLLIGVVGWWQFSEQRLARQFAAERAEMTETFAAERQAAVAAAAESSRAQVESAYRLFGSSLGWAVRSALLRDNLDQVDQYFTQLVQEKRVRLAALAAPDGKILLASDRNLQDSAFASHFPESLLSVREVTVASPDAAARYMAIPFMGLSQQLGVVVLAFNTAPGANTAPAAPAAR
jgi:hypothetical protein